MFIVNFHHALLLFTYEYKFLLCICLDDNECDLGTHNCGLARECRNIPGSFRCVRKRCKYGFRLNYITGNCDPVQCRTGRRADKRGSCVGE